MCLFQILNVTKWSISACVPLLRGHSLLKIKVVYLYVFQFYTKPVIILQELFVSTLTLLQLRLKLSLIVPTHLLEFLQLLLSLLSPGDRAMYNTSKISAQHMLRII